MKKKKVRGVEEFVYYLVPAGMRIRVPFVCLSCAYTKDRTWTCAECSCHNNTPVTKLSTPVTKLNTPVTPVTKLNSPVTTLHILSHIRNVV